MSDFRGVIIAESLADAKVLQHVTIVKTIVEPVTEQHKTPWLAQWTLHTVSVPAAQVQATVNELSRGLEAERPWYADLNDGETYFVIFFGLVFHWRKGEAETAETAKAYGRGLGIPEYQLDFPV